MPPVAIFVTDTLSPEARAILAGYDVAENSPDDGFLERCQALICWPSRVKPDTLGKMVNLRMIQTLSAGVDGLAFESIPKSVQVYSNAGAYTESVAEHAWGMLLGIAKGMHVRNVRTTPITLRRKTLLVLGCGAIGSEVARLAKSIDMRTIGVSRSFRLPEFFDERHPLPSLEERVRAADAIVDALPLTKKTRGVVSYEILSKAKEAAILVNVGRGETVDEEGVLRWLKERPESRFATDVYWTREGRESFATRAWDLTNFAGTLHNSGVPLGEDLSTVKAAAAKNVKRYFENESAMNRVDVDEYL